MTFENRLLQERTRRQLFQDCGVGVGKMALASLVAESCFAKHHFTPRIDHVIYLFMAGGPSQLELLDYKPELQKLHGQPTPDSFLNGKRFAFMDTFAKEKPKLLATNRTFKQYGGSGVWVSDLLPQIASMADDLAV